MKKLILFLSLVPILAQGQQFEFGANYGNTFDATVAVKLFHHLKAGIGYKYAKFTSTSIFGVTSQTKMSVPYGFIEYYIDLNKNEFYGGIDVGKMYLMDLLPGLTYSSGNEYGVHAGYSRRIIKGLAANVQVGFFYFHTKISDNSVSGTTNSYGVFAPVTIGVHYVISPWRKKAK